MNVISITGASGGAGATMLAAHLAVSIGQQGHRTLAFDFSPFNTLRLHFGMDWNVTDGLAPQLLAGKPWNEAAWRSPDGIDFMPYGTLEHDSARQQFDALFDPPRAARWFSDCLATLDIPDDAWIINDVPFPFTPLRAQIVAASTIRVAVLAPDAMSSSNAGRIADCLRPDTNASLRFVLNGYDASRDLDHDVRYLLRAQLGNALAPVVVHRDESLREALASKQTVFDYAPSSQAASDLTRLAFWLTAAPQSATA